MSFLKKIKQQFVKPEKRVESKTGYAQQLGLTPREMDVFRLLIEGFTLQQTAEQLGVKYTTVNTHMTTIYKKLGVRSRAELIIRYRDFEKEREL